MNNIYWLDGPWLGHLAIVARPRGGEWLADDVRDWRQKGIEIVISLLTNSENQDLGLTQEAATCAAQGIAFVAFPIADRAVPPSLREMRQLVETVTKQLTQGKNVAIHCRQGVGRSGLLAATLLVDTGTPVVRAFAQIETARGCQVPDTAEQREWVEKFAVLAPMPAW
jgi:protein-tyrosine phosphatase